MEVKEADAPSKQSCKACKSDIALGVQFCDVCKSWQGEPCKVCGRRLPVEGKFCNECSTDQRGPGWPFGISQSMVALLSGLIGVTSPAILAVVYLLNNNSDTSLMVTGIDTDRLTTYAWNTGRKPGRLMTAVVDFGRYPYEEEQLEPSDQLKTLIPGGGTGVVVDFRISTLKEQVKDEKQKARAPELIVEVRESNDRSHKEHVPLEASAIETLINQKNALGQVRK